MLPAAAVLVEFAVLVWIDVAVCRSPLVAWVAFCCAACCAAQSSSKGEEPDTELIDIERLLVIVVLSRSARCAPMLGLPFTGLCASPNQYLTSPILR